MSPRPPLPPEQPPALSLVAEAALALDPTSPVVAYLRTLPQVRGWMERTEANRCYERLRADGLAPYDAQRVVAAKFHVSQRTVRYWVYGL